MADYDDETFRKIFSRFPQRIAELDRQNAKLEEKRLGQVTREAEILLTEKQAELSQLFLLDNLSIFQVAQMLAWSNEISDHHINESFQAIDKILTAHFEKVTLTLPIVEKAVLSGELECEIYRNPTDDTSIDRDKSTITRSAVRNWLLKKPGYFSTGFFPEIKNPEDWESVRQRMLSEQENNECLREQPGLLTEAIPSGNTELNDALAPFFSDLRGKRVYDVAEICSRLGYGKNSMSAVRGLMKDAGIEFDYDPEKNNKKFLTLEKIEKLIEFKRNRKKK